jgi:hypothetical protein
MNYSSMSSRGGIPGGSLSMSKMSKDNSRTMVKQGSRTFKKSGSKAFSKSNTRDFNEIDGPMAPMMRIDVWSGAVTPVEIESPTLSRKNTTHFDHLKFPGAGVKDNSRANCSTRASSLDHLAVDNTLAEAARRLSICSDVSELNAAEAAEALHQFEADINPDHHALAKTWGLWEKRAWTDKYSDEDDWHYRQNCKAIKEFATIESFMELFNGCPLPSEILKQQQMVRNFPTEEVHPARQNNNPRRKSILGDVPQKSKNQKLDCLMFFERGVFPTWEDAAHKEGGMFQFLFKSDFNINAIDQVWENLLFNVMGNTLESGDVITGIRLCDRMNADADKIAYGMKDTARTAIRIEIWHRKLESNEERSALFAQLKAVLTSELLCGGCAKTVGKSKRSGETLKVSMAYSEAVVERKSVNSLNEVDKTKRSSV